MRANNGCPVCGGYIFKRTPYFYRFGGRTIEIVQCFGCNLGTLSPMLSAEDITALYSVDYFKSDYHCGVLSGSYADELESLRKEFHPTLSLILGFKKEGTFLEIGCAGGAMLAEARDHGYQTIGVELSPEMASWGRNHLGLDIRTGTLEGQKFLNHAFDVVFLGDVMEHLPDPKQTLVEIRRILKSDGILVLAYPMELNHMAPRLRRLIGLRRESPHKPYHLFYYNTSNMRRLLEGLDFHVLLGKEDKLVRIHPAMSKLLDQINHAATTVFGVMGDRGVSIAAPKR